MKLPKWFDMVLKFQVMVCLFLGISFAIKGNYVLAVFGFGVFCFGIWSFWKKKND